MNVEELLDMLEYNIFNLFIRYECALNTQRLWKIRWEVEHISLSKQLLSTIHIYDNS